MAQKNVAIYPGTFNPVTSGHIDIVHRAAKMFDKIYICVAESQHKNPLFSLDERVALIESIAFADHVEVIGFRKLLIDLCHELNANVIIRGLRMVSDFEYEFQLASMNRHLDPQIETIFLTPAEDKSFISSTIVREVAKLGGDVTQLVPQHVAAALREKYAP
ncbi:pantetheine-phosphate adenylyltransferase [Ostreibacterium oceani]|uniref:Phosphopantetheine adenylyltransferase n=1 Tax=Ostreibacterium oceani TaxID=2654998 RepID=A0A6N7ET28_9GAMM|nr:pantetheine-phosphate adenylyltransferase [Ostreibacterium oceani]MPV85994.1 pantetheine-phosphate adenylyltransferase [Ostreibacterium oceani]